MWAASQTNSQAALTMWTRQQRAFLWHLLIESCVTIATEGHTAVFDTADAFGVQNACRPSNSVQKHD